MPASQGKGDPSARYVVQSKKKIRGNLLFCPENFLFLHVRATHHVTHGNGMTHFTISPLMQRFLLLRLDVIKTKNTKWTGTVLQRLSSRRASELLLLECRM